MSKKKQKKKKTYPEYKPNRPKEVVCGAFEGTKMATFKNPYAPTKPQNKRLPPHESREIFNQAVRQGKNQGLF